MGSEGSSRPALRTYFVGDYFTGTRLRTGGPVNKIGARILFRTPQIKCCAVLLPISSYSGWFLRLRGLHAQLVADELEGGGDGLVHVVVLVAAQATGEDHVALLRRQLLVLLVEGLVLGVVDGVVGLVAGLPVRRVLARDDGLVLRAELEVLVLDDAGVGDLALGVVDHGHALVVGLVERLGLEAQAAVLECAQLEVVERVDGAAVDRPGGDIGLGGHLLGQMGAGGGLWVGWWCWPQVILGYSAG